MITDEIRSLTQEMLHSYMQKFLGVKINGEINMNAVLKLEASM